VQLNACENGVIVTRDAITIISTSNLKTKGICRWSIRTSSPEDKIEITFESIADGVFVDVSAPRIF